MPSPARINPPFRADHVGSLKRPPTLQQAREKLLGPHDAAHNLGPHRNAELRALEDGYVRDVVALQERVGLQSITDGEFRRRTWWTDFVLGLEGTAINYSGKTFVGVDRQGGQRPLPEVTVHGKIRWRGSVVADAFAFVRSVTSRTPKLTIPSPPIVHYMSADKRINRDVYPDPAAFWDDLVQAYRAEVQALASAGCTYLQLDECMIAFLCDPTHRDWVRATLGEDPDRLLRTYASVINGAIAGRPATMTVAMHMCRGNMSGHWFAEGGYEPVAEVVFNGIDVDAYFLEYDSPRAGTFEPLRLVPKTKTVVLGLVSTKTPELESADELRRRIDEASRHVPLDQLCLSPQCGFSSNYIGNPVTVDDQTRKLARIVEVASEVWSVSEREGR
jgi:5-methyltetrahydropteroyltriglutamate--homocysteine methyltransferase